MVEAVGKTGMDQAREAMGHMAVQQTEEVVGRIVVQQCLSASLKLKAAENEVPEIVEVSLISILVLYLVN